MMATVLGLLGLDYRVDDPPIAGGRGRFWDLRGVGT